MDRFYDKVGASAKLEEIAAARRKALTSRKDAVIVHLADIELQDVKVQQLIQGRRNWRLCIPDEDGEVNDELVVRLQGIMFKNGLVPRNVQACAANKAHLLTQHIEICGLDTATFTDSVAKLHTVHERFAQQLAGVEVAPIVDRDVVSTDKFVASNRIFSLKSDVPNEQDNMFEDGVDAAGLLKKIQPTDFIHAPENIVKYFRARAKAEGGTSYLPFYPGGFQVGDIVELQVSFVAMATAKSKVKITTRLQAVTLLDSEYSMEASLARSAAALNNPINAAIRRKVGYFLEDEEEAEHKAKRARTGSPEEGLSS
ncbi:hypothetical protein B0H16DRAFT_1468139 [Mycena metata]|uniref:Uncharacterized protein n=1 Tax=Mycena metata TaxID=1033252 RepID=A0AAD7MW73_9AGAR|nr:hypothetical protein B0H16DRAFT_1468139 [Mycena metata]